MENQRTEYIQAVDYERSESRQSQRNSYYERDFTTRVGTLELKSTLEHVMVNLHRRCLSVISEMKRHCSFHVRDVCLRCFYPVKFQRLLRNSVENRYRNLLFLA